VADRQRSGSGPRARSPVELADLRRRQRAVLTDAYVQAQDAYLTARESFRRMQVAHDEGRFEEAEEVEFQARIGDFRALTRVLHELARTHREPVAGAGTRP
jgi:hypothetical protein